jgi:D-amino peptidase
MRAFLFLVFCTALQAAQGPRIFMVTDLEGVTGVYSWDEQVMPGQRRFEESRRLLIAEVNAAIQGALEGGASEVVVWDGHDSSRTLSVEDLLPHAKLIQDIRTPGSYYLDEIPCQGLMFVGQHAKAGTPKGLLAHSEDLIVQNMFLNGKTIGEIGQIVALAGYFKVPVIMLTGDQAACDEVREYQPTAETVAVKRMVGTGSALSLSHTEARALIREAARRAVKRLGEFKPWVIEGPVEIRWDFNPEKTKTGEIRQRPSRVYRGRNVLEALQEWAGK